MRISNEIKFICEYLMIIIKGEKSQMISRDSNLRQNKILIAKNLYLTKRIKNNNKKKKHSTLPPVT